MEIQTMEMIDVKKMRRKAKRLNKIALRQENLKEIFTSFGGLPKCGESYHIISNGGYDCICYLDYIIDQLGEIDYLALSTWIINRDNAGRLFKYIDNRRIKDGIIILSNRTRQLRKQDWGFIIEGFLDRNFKIKVPHSHAKVFSTANYENKTFITVSGSGNWNENKRIENYIIDNDEHIFYFHKNWMNEIYKL